MKVLVLEMEQDVFTQISQVSSSKRSVYFCSAADASIFGGLDV